MRKVETREIQFKNYKGIVPESILADVLKGAEKLRGLHVIHVNATPVGGGVAEILKSLVPMMRSVGINTDWYALDPDESFFRVTKALHHCLQGEPEYPGKEELELYLAHNEKAARTLRENGVVADLWIVHDAQVVPLLHYLNVPSPAIWVCHVDTTQPNEFIRETLLPYISDYQRVVFSMPEYHLEGLDLSKVSVVPPAIDPLSPKNIPIARHQALETLARLGIDTSRPLVSQVSRFDRWKDPWGVIDAYRIAKQRFPGLQLALVGVMTAKDDADALEVFNNVQEYAAGDADIHLYSNPLVIGDFEVNAFQTGSDVIVQKSTREGFGLSVAEAMWKGTPVVGGDCGGIRLQICDGESGFLVSDIASCAERLVLLLDERELAHRLGETGRESVKRSFLMPRLLRDYLDLIVTLVHVPAPALAIAA